MKLTKLSVDEKFSLWAAPGRKCLHLSHRTMLQDLGSNCGLNGDAIHLKIASPKDCDGKE